MMGRELRRRELMGWEEAGRVKERRRERE